MKMHRWMTAVAALAIASTAPIADAAEKAEIERVFSAAREDSQAMEHLDYLSNRIGARLTGSDGLTASAAMSGAAARKARAQSRRRGIVQRPWGQTWWRLPGGSLRHPSQLAAVLAASGGGRTTSSPGKSRSGSAGSGSRARLSWTIRHQ